MTASTWELTSRRAHLRAVAAVGGPGGFSEAVAHVLGNASPDIQLGMFRAAPVTSLSASGADAFVEKDVASRALVGLGIHECLTIVGVDSGGYSLALQAYLPTGMRPSRRIVSRWSRVASHLSAGFRVRRGLSDALARGTPSRDPLFGGEAILTAAGKLAHAEDPAKQAHATLAQAVVTMNLARGSLRAHDPDAALESWKGLIAGRWSLVDHVDTDGKRFLVARKNDPRAVGPAAVSERECQVMAARARGLSFKLIAYDLGLSMASVSRCLQSGMTKLGLSHEAELVALFAAPAAVSSRRS